MNLLHKIKHLFSICLVIAKNIWHVAFSTLLIISRSIEYYTREVFLFSARAFLNLLSRCAKVMDSIDFSKVRSIESSFLTKASMVLKRHVKGINESIFSSLHSIKLQVYKSLHYINPFAMVNKVMGLTKELVSATYENTASYLQKKVFKLARLTSFFTHFSKRRISKLFSYANPKRLIPFILLPLIAIDKILGRIFDEFINGAHKANRGFNKTWKGTKKILLLMNPLIILNIAFFGFSKIISYQKSLYKAFTNGLLKMIAMPLSLLRKAFLGVLEVANKVVEIIANAVYGFVWVAKLPYHSMVISGRVLALSTAHTSNYILSIIRSIQAFIARIMGALKVYRENIKKAIDFNSIPEKLKSMWNTSNERVDHCIDVANTILKSEEEQANPNTSTQKSNEDQKNSKFQTAIDRMQAIFRLIRMMFVLRFNNLINAISIESKKIIEKNEKEIAEAHSPINRAINSKPSSAIMIMLFSFAGLTVAFLIFASIWEIPRYANAKGRIETYDQLQTIMAFDGAVVEKILVEEDQQVHKGQELIRFDKTVYEAKYKDLQEKYYSKLGLIASLEARSTNIPLVLVDSIKNYSQRVYDEVTSAHKAAINVYETNYELINNQLLRKEKEVEEDRKDKELYIEQLDLVKKQLNILSKLADSELVSKLRLIDTQKEMLSTQIKLKNVESSLLKAEGELRELENRKSNFLSTYSKEVLNDITTTRNELSGIVADMTSVKDLLNRSTISSPINGVVYRISTRAVPGHAISGQEIITIVPSDGGLVMTGLVTPSEIGFIKKGQKVNIKITTYDYSIYGTLDGVVERISPDTIQNRTDGMFYYEVVVKSEHNYIEYKGKKFYIKPGMDASADFDMDSRTLLRYMIDPFVKTLGEAFSEN